MNQESSDSSLSDSDLYDESEYRRKRLNNKKSYWKKNPIKLCANLTAKFLTKANKLKIIKVKLDEDPLQRCIYFLTFVESPEMIFSQYKENCELLLDDPKIGGGGIIDFVKKAIRNLLYANIDVHSRRLFAEFSGDGLKYIVKLQSHFARMTFSDKSKNNRIFSKSHINEGRQQ